MRSKESRGVDENIKPTSQSFQMSIKRLLLQLGKIEEQTSEGLSDGALSMLVATLGKLDAMFYPWRSIGSFRGAVAVLCGQYRAKQYGIAARGAGLEQWKSASNERAQLQNAGLAIATTAHSQTTGLVLTPEGLSMARALTGTPGRIEVGVRLMQSKQADWRNGWCSESTLFGRELSGNPSDWEELTELVVPAQIAGCVYANCDCDGRVFYRLDSQEFTELPPCDRKPEQWAVDAYLQAYKTERRALQTLEDNDGLIIPIPKGGY